MWSVSYIFMYTAFYAALISKCFCQKKVTTTFTDPSTGITFERFFGVKTSFSFGIALPETANNSFIGQLTFPLNDGAGWGGWSLTDDMEGPLLMAAWADGGKVVSSFRQAFNEDDNPPEVTGNFRARPIAAGTSANSSFFTYTFLCEGCLDDALGLGTAATSGTVKMGWALSSEKVGNPASPAAILNFHNRGFGGFQARLAQAKNGKFDEWAAMAGAPLAPATNASPITSKKKKNKGNKGNKGEGPGNASDDDSDDDD
ncbi:putative cellobiose dehydrogenase [Metarhizium anisopliae]